MAYVARYSHDLFVSYAHNDASDWIEGFQKGLRQELAERLGQEASIWQDTRKLRLGQDWKSDIEDAVKGAAAFLAIVSPSYQRSEWCAKERKLFMNQFPSRRNMKVETKSGSAFRLMKVHKLPWEDDAHLGFLEDVQYVDFFARDSADDIPDELMPGTDSFRASMRKTAHALASLLLAMRRMGETVFVATPADDVARSGEALRNELLAQGYDVQPEGPLDEAYSDDAIRKVIGGAKLSVHLLGDSYDPGAERLADLVQDLDTPRVVWLSGNNAEEKQRALIERLSSGDVGGPAPTILRGSQARLIEEVRQLLVPRPQEAPSLTSNGDGSVYLICDLSSPEDAAAGTQLKQKIQEAEGFEVFLPATGASSGALIDQHARKLRDCDGLLLYQHRAPLPWLVQNYADVMSAKKAREKPVRSMAFVVDEPAMLAQAPNVIAHRDPLTLDLLAPFLTALRAGGGTETDART